MHNLVQFFLNMEINIDRKLLIFWLIGVSINDKMSKLQNAYSMWSYPFSQ